MKNEACKQSFFGPFPQPPVPSNANFPTGKATAPTFGKEKINLANSPQPQKEMVCNNQGADVITNFRRVNAGSHYTANLMRSGFEMQQPPTSENEPLSNFFYYGIKTLIGSWESCDWR